MFTLLIIAVFFLLSLFGAVILFKFFKSAALVQTKKYQAGGAIAGFIIIYALLYTSYNMIEKGSCQDIIEKYELANKRVMQLEEIVKPKIINGRITPYRKDAKVVLAVKETDTDGSGRFRLNVPCINPEKDDVRLYIILDGDYIPLNIYSEEEMKDIDIPIESYLKNQ